jgi:hypothetical protein
MSKCIWDKISITELIDIMAGKVYNEMVQGPCAHVVLP